MKLQAAPDLIDKESRGFAKELAKKGVPIEDIDVDLDDADTGDPFVHLYINLDPDWFYDEIGDLNGR